MSLAEIETRVEAACAAAGRPRAEVTLVAVSKVQPEERVREVLEVGQRVFGENRVQEAEGRWPPFLAEFEGVRLHLIGPLQTNKLARALELFEAIHSLDRDSLARKLATAVQARGACPELFVQVNTGAEPQKAGVLPDALDGFLADCRGYDLKVSGLMCIPPAEEDPDPHFADLAEMAARNGLSQLSMGMSGDFEAAIARGATHVRVGSAIFGEPGLMSDRRFHLRLAALTLAAVTVALVWRGSAPDPAPPRLVEARGDLAADEAATVALFEEARDSVVFITTSERAVDPWSRDLEETPRGAGSGVIWDASGHIVTNAHVLAGASSALVRKADGTAVRAALVGMSPAHDLAVLRIRTGDAPLRPAPLGTSRDLRVGQKVFAIGSPFGLDWTLTTGIVSALDREFLAKGSPELRGLIQTDAAINPGNSGGPLLDSAGRLIGVNTAIYSPSGASAGVGFAVPVDEVNRIVPQLIATGRYAPPSLGVESDARLNALAARRGIAGVVVLAVKPGSAAARAGIRPVRTTAEGGIALGDVIVGIDGTEIADPGDLRAALDPLEAGDEVEVTVLREGEPLRLRATLEPG